ncbi:MAG: D-alanyl-D-alanine carboxypeptidase [Labilithrix sp.]|nr:D-alanyl-D-alanine carboxypeptidase [Labilithrix sp.]
MSRRAATLAGVLAIAAVACGRGSRTAATDAALANDGALSGDAPFTSDAALFSDAALSADAGSSEGGSDASAPGTGASRATDPFGIARAAARTYCSGVAGKHVAERDLRTSFVSGDDLLALVNRAPTGVLAQDYAPSDLVDLRTGDAKQPADCEKVQCLRKEAASALTELLAEMKRRSFPGKVESAFRGYATQCGTFLRWAAKGTFCDATEQSALPGHSQHQLGTTVDLFTEEWAKDPRGVFREGFGCTPAGRFLQEHATDAGFVMPYPIHPDDRHPRQTCVARWDIPISINPKTGYRFEHWHLRYVGKEAAARFAKTLAASGPGTPNELTLEQWLRREKGLPAEADAELPVCDGCNCGACSTLASLGESACDKHGGALHLDEHGRPLPAAGAPAITGVKRSTTKRWKGDLVEVSVTVPDHVTTQPPIVGPDGAGYAAGATYEKLAPYPDTQPRAFAPIPGTWVVGVEPVANGTAAAWPWRGGLSTTLVGQTYDRANVVLPAHPGAITLKIPVPEGAGKVRVVLLEGGAPRGEPITLE